MSIIEQNEQWKLRGDCSICRRSKYCSKPCTRCKQRREREQRMLVGQVLNRMTGGAMNEILNKFDNLCR